MRIFLEGFMKDFFARSRSVGSAIAGRLAGLIVATMLLLALGSAAGAQQLFQTPEAAGKALATAAKSGDVRAIMRVLGPEGAEVASSGDPVADTGMRKKFAEAYEVKNRIAVDGDKATLYVGPGDWPFPIPLIRRNETWRFDAALGKEEILQRRIGRNELSAIQACLAYVDAQEEYAAKDRTGAGVGVYAQRIVSRPGRKDGLYWPPQQGDDSPIGEYVARATSEGYRVGQQGRQPFHGYYYKVLTRQGPDARGGAMDYVVRGNMIGGFALVAYPAEYDNSGVMTFIVNQDGTVYEKDMGPNTLGLASNMTAFNPDSSWRKVVNNGIPLPKRKGGETEAKPNPGDAQTRPTVGEAQPNPGPGEAPAKPREEEVQARPGQ